jgi:small multidrug resistance pump
MITNRFLTHSATGLYLLLAILLEVAGTTSMKLSDGFNVMLPSILIFVFYSLSFVFLTLTLKRLEVSFVYAIWSGLGTLLIAVIGIFFFHESVTLIKILSLFLIIGGIVGLRLG